MADIAREAGVAKSTVSRYFNGGYVKEETREKIREVVERTGFEPSQAAQNLKAKQTRIIGVVAPTMTSSTTGRLLSAIDQTLHKQGYACMIMTSNHDPAREIASIEYLRSMRVDGIILIATNINEEHQLLAQKSEIPFLTMGQQFDQGVSIIYDDYSAGKTIGQYASVMGHQDVCYIGASIEDHAVGVVRRRGVLDGLARFTHVSKFLMEETSFSYEDTQKLVRELLDLHVPDLFICATDLMALACLKEVRSRGLRVPEDVSIIGFGGYERSALVTPSLTTIRFENEEAGRLCAQTILKMIRKEPVEKLQVLGYQFVKGASVSDMRSSHPFKTENA